MMKTMTIKGIGKLSLKPDYTVVAMSLSTLEKEYDEAMERAAKNLERLREALQEIGFSKDDLKTSDFNVSTEYESRRDKSGEYKRYFAGYRIRHQLKLEFDFDMKLLSKTLGAISGCLAEPELNIQFTVKDREAVNAALLKGACQNAKTKAEILANASGVALGELLSIDYSWGELHLYSSTRYEMEDACMMKASAPTANMDIEPDDIDVSEGVTFIWAIQ